MASVHDFREYAQRTMSSKAFKELDDGSADQVTRASNESDFIKIKMKHRGMANMKFFKGTNTLILGHSVQTPIGLGPIPNQKRFNFDGELASAQAAKGLGIIYTVDVRSSYPLE